MYQMLSWTTIAQCANFDRSFVSFGTIRTGAPLTGLLALMDIIDARLCDSMIWIKVYISQPVSKMYTFAY